MCSRAEQIQSPSTERPDVAIVTLRKVTRRLIPFLFFLYIVAWIDRVNVGFSALQMNSDLGFSSAAFGFGSGVFFLGYCLFEVASNLLLYRVGARRWIARIMVSWGAISVAMMFVRIPLTFYVLRFLLGVAEAGFFPGAISVVDHGCGVFGCALLPEPRLAVLSLALVPGWALCRVWSVLVDTDTVPHWTGGGRWHCVGGDNRQCGWLPGSNPRRRAEGSLRHARPCVHAARRLWNYCGASRPPTSACCGPEQCTLCRAHHDGPRMRNRFQECFVGSLYQLAFQQIRWKTWGGMTKPE